MYQSTQILQDVPAQEAQQEVQSWRRQASGGKAVLRVFLVGWCEQGDVQRPQLALGL